MIAYLGEIGRVISQTTGIDWSTWSAKQVKLQKPDLSTVTFATGDVIVDDAVTGQIHIVTVAGNLNLVGEYLMQAKLTTAGGAVLYGPLTSFDVEGIL